MAEITLVFIGSNCFWWSDRLNTSGVLAQLIWTLPMQPRINQSDISVGSSKSDEVDLHLIVWLSAKSSNSTVQMLCKDDKKTLKASDCNDCQLWSYIKISIYKKSTTSHNPLWGEISHPCSPINFVKIGVRISYYIFQKPRVSFCIQAGLSIPYQIHVTYLYSNAFINDIYVYIYIHVLPPDLALNGIHSLCHQLRMKQQLPD